MCARTYKPYIIYKLHILYGFPVLVVVVVYTLINIQPRVAISAVEWLSGWVVSREGAGHEWRVREISDTEIAVESSRILKSLNNRAGHIL